MKKPKRLGRGLEDISHYFVSQHQTGIKEHPVLHETVARNQYKSVSFVDITDPQRGAGLCAEVGIGLSRNGIRVLLIDADVRFPGISFMLGLSLPGFSLEHYYQDRYEPSDIVCTGPYGVKLLAPHLSVNDVSSKSQTKKSRISHSSNSTDSWPRLAMLRMCNPNIKPIIDEALF